MLSNHTITARLDEELVAWMTTVTAGGRPQTSPIWYLRDGEELLVYSLESARARNVARNPNVSINLNSDAYGSRVVTMEGTARIDETVPPASEHGRYLAKYRERIASYGWTPESFSRDYSVPIRITITRIRNW